MIHCNTLQHTAAHQRTGRRRAHAASVVHDSLCTKALKLLLHARYSWICPSIIWCVLTYTYQNAQAYHICISIPTISAFFKYLWKTLLDSLWVWHMHRNISHLSAYCRNDTLMSSCAACTHCNTPATHLQHTCNTPATHLQHTVGNFSTCLHIVEMLVSCTHVALYTYARYMGWLRLSGSLK